MMFMMLILLLLAHYSLALKLNNAFKVTMKPLIATSIGLSLMSAPALAVSKTEFLNEASKGVAIEEVNKDDYETKVKREENKESYKQIQGVRVVDLGGNRGARGLASDGNTVSKGSLADQLKAYGGEGTKPKVDNSLKNPLVYKDPNADFANKLKLYQQMNK